MNRKALLPQLDDSISQIDSLVNGRPFSSEHTKWLTKTLSVLERAFGTKSRYYATFRSYNWRFRGTTMVMVDELLQHGHPDAVMAARDAQAYRAQLDSARGVLEAARDELASGIDDAPAQIEPSQKLPETRFDVFLSYASSDSELANELKKDLEDEGITCFLAEKDLQVGKEWQESIRTALLESRFVLLLITPSSVNRPWLLLEAGAAWALDKPMIPALSHVSPSDLIVPISKYQCMKIETTSQRAKLIQQIKAA